MSEGWFTGVKMSDCATYRDMRKSRERHGPRRHDRELCGQIEAALLEAERQRRARMSSRLRPCRKPDRSRGMITGCRDNSRRAGGLSGSENVAVLSGLRPAMSQVRWWPMG